MVDEAHDRLDADAAHLRQALLVPRPAALLRLVRRDPFPGDGVAQGAHAERPHLLQVRDAVMVARLAELVAQHVAHADHAALDATPDLELGCRQGTAGQDWPGGHLAIEHLFVPSVGAARSPRDASEGRGRAANPGATWQHCVWFTQALDGFREMRGG
jgi:hypothetical protein